MALITYLTKIQFDHGALGLLSEELAGLGIQRPMIVTDPGLAASINSYKIALSALF